MFGLKQEEINKIKVVLKKNGVKKSIIFGSRAKGNFKNFSDIDIAIDGNENRVSYCLNEESNLPYYFDIINLNTIKNPKLSEHIKRVGIEF